MRAPQIVALVIMALTGCAIAPLTAHDGVREQIVQLSLRIAQEPGVPELFVRRAELNRQAGEQVAARADVERAVTLGARGVELDLVRARLATDAHRPAEAVTWLSNVLALEPGHLQARLLRGRAYAASGQRADAVRDLTRVLDQSPTPDVAIERARLLEQSPADLDAALDSLEEARRRMGPLVTIELEALAVEQRLRRYDAALSRLDAITARSPRKEQWLARRGSLLEEAGRPLDARVAYEAARDAAGPLSPPARPTAGRGSGAASARRSRRR